MSVGVNRVLLGRITNVHGLKGEVVVQAFTGVPEDIAAYGPLEDAAGGRRVELTIVRVGEKGIIARIEGVRDRTAAEAMKGTELWLPRDRLPPAAEGEYYHADLVGLAAVDAAGMAIGRVVTVVNYGAGDLLEIQIEGTHRTELVAFTDAFVPVVDIAGGRVVVILTASPDEDNDT